MAKGINDFTRPKTYAGTQKTIKLSEENDTFDGGAVGSTIYGLGGDDVIWGGKFGGSKAEAISADLIYGGSGNDHIFGEGGWDGLNGDSGEDVIWGGLGWDTIRGNADRDILYGEGDKDFIYGGTGRDYLNGGTEGDYLYGEQDNDTLDGGAGGDWLEGGTGIDQIHLGAGVGVTDFVAIKKGDIGSSIATTDTIYDFVSGTDELLFYGYTKVVGERITFHTTAGFINNGQVQMYFGNKVLEIDSDGNGHADAYIKFDTGTVAVGDITSYV